VGGDRRARRHRALGVVERPADQLLGSTIARTS
jgi:hypothetical protein